MNNHDAYNPREHSHKNFYFGESSKNMHKHTFEKKGNFVSKTCIHCSLDSHKSYSCPNRFRINPKKFIWVVKTKTANK